MNTILNHKIQFFEILLVNIFKADLFSLANFISFNLMIALMKASLLDNSTPGLYENVSLLFLEPITYVEFLHLLFECTILSTSQFSIDSSVISSSKSRGSHN